MFWIIVVLFVTIYVYLKYHVYSYWKQRGVPYDEPSIPLGNIKLSYFLGKINIGDMFRVSYEKLKNHPFHGIYAFYHPVLSVNDPELIKTILIKEFAKFPDRGWYSNEEVEPASAHLFLIGGEKWKRLRTKLTPMFTSNKLREMQNIMAEVSNTMIRTFELELEKSNVVEIKDILARYTTDVISSLVYGFNCHSLQNPNNEFRHYGTKTFTIGKLSWLLCIFLSDFLDKLWIPYNTQDIHNFFLKILKDTINHRKKEKVVRKDFLNLLMQLIDRDELADEQEDGMPAEKMEQVEGTMDKLTLKEVSAQCFLFFAAGFETSSSTATYTLVELALHPEMQEKLREEIDEVAKGSGFTYESIMQMEYLDMVINETVRKHPPLPFLSRICIEDFKIPDSNYTIPKGMRILISVSGLHHDPDIYPNPETFDPMRFSKENLDTKSTIINLGFGEGPRNCIGKRFGLIQTKQAVVAILRKYKIHICDKTTIPVRYTTDSIVQMPESGVYLRFEKRVL